MISKKDLINFRLESIEDAQTRSRFAFFLTLVVCAAIIAALWNQYFSWEKFNVYNLKEIVDDKKLPSKPTNSFHNVNAVDNIAMSGHHVLVAEAIRNWNKSQWITIPLLGIQMSISDVAILGSMALWVLTFWYYLTIRRENTEIGTLLRDSHADIVDDTTVKYIFSGVRSHSVFTVITKLRPINSLESSLNTSFDNTNNRVVYFLDFLPFLVCIFIVLSDVFFAFFYQSPYRPFEGPTIFWDLTAGELGSLLGMDVFGLLMSYFIFLNCRRVVVLEKATSDVLREYFFKYQDKIIGSKIVKDETVD